MQLLNCSQTIASAIPQAHHQKVIEIDCSCIRQLLRVSVNLVVHYAESGLRDAHWAAACGGRPEPALLTPLTAATALALGSGRQRTAAEARLPHGVDAEQRRPLAPYALRRALAAAERRCIVLPKDWLVTPQTTP